MKKQLFSVVMIGALLSSTMYANAAFTDVSASTQTKLDYLISIGVVSDQNATFRPTDIVNRAESLKLILASSQINIDVPDVAGSFKDVVAGSWYAPYVNSGIELGVVKGYADGTLKPEQTVNKGEFVTMLFRMHKKLRGGTDTGMQYSDVKASDWYADSAAWSTLFLNDSTFEASKQLTREETASIIYAYMNHFTVAPNNAFGRLYVGGMPTPEKGGMGMPMNGSGAVMPDDMKETSMLPYPYYTYNTTYEYTGPTLADFPESVDVIKSINKAPTAISIPGFFDDLGSVAKVFSSMKDINLGYITFTPAIKDGFTYAVDKAFGSFSISEDWRQVRPMQEYRPLTDEPTDAQLIAMANRFLMDKGISTEGYGSPIVDKSWKMYLMEGERYIPDYYTVYYPKMVEGTILYGIGGYYDQALNVSINYSNKTVSSVSGFLPRLEVKSAYTGKTWSDVLTAFDEGGMFSPRNNEEIPADAQEYKVSTKVTLTSARKVMTSLYDYESTDENGNPTLHYVPAVLFSGTSVTSYPDAEPFTNPDVKMIVPAVDDAELNIPMYY